MPCFHVDRLCHIHRSSWGHLLRDVEIYYFDDWHISWNNSCLIRNICYVWEFSSFLFPQVMAQQNSSGSPSCCIPYSICNLSLRGTTPTGECLIFVSLTARLAPSQKASSHECIGPFYLPQVCDVFPQTISVVRILGGPGSPLLCGPWNRSTHVFIVSGELLCC